MAMKFAKFVIKRGVRSKKFRFTLVSRNGEVVATSELYTTKGKCKQGARAVISAVYDLAAGSEISDETTRGVRSAAQSRSVGGVGPHG